MNQKLFTLSKNRQLSCAWAPTGDAHAPLRCRWTIGFASSSGAAPRGGDKEGTR